VGEFRDEQPWKTRPPTSASFEPLAKVTCASERQPEKQLRPIRSTDAGMPIEASDEQAEKAPLSISDKTELRLNSTRESRAHSEKQLTERDSTDPGIQTDVKKEQCPNASGSIDPRFAPGSKLKL
jgi:hypothetical protein